jgi:hypothetical protein
MAADVTVRLILYGLVAFATDQDGNPTRLYALLVDAGGQQYASDGCKIHRHVPALYVDAEKCTINGRFCRISDQVDLPDDPISGGWRLDRESLQIVVEDAGAVQQLSGLQLELGARSTRPGSELPTSTTDSKSLQWVPKIDGVRLDRDCLTAARDCPVISRFDIDQGRVASCHLTEAQDTYQVHAFAFKAVSASTSSPLIQAMSDAVMVEFTVRRGAKVKLISRDFQRPDWIKKEIVLEAGAERDTIDVWLANVPPRDEVSLEHDAGCHQDGDRIDRHFELYYGLSAKPIPFAQRLVPHRIETMRAEAVGLQPGHCPILTFGGMDSARRLLVENHEHDANSPGKVPKDWNSCGNILLSAPSP